MVYTHRLANQKARNKYSFLKSGFLQAIFSAVPVPRMAETEDLDDILNDALDELDQEEEEEIHSAAHSTSQAPNSSVKSKAAVPVEATGAGTSTPKSTSTVASSASTGIGTDEDEEKDLKETIARTIEMLGKMGGGEGGKEGEGENDTFDDAFLSKLVAEFDKLGAGFESGAGEGDGEKGGGKEGATDTMVDSMVRQLLTKDLMYPPLKEVTRQFPAWLESNKGKVEDGVYEKHRAQYELFEKIVAVYEGQDGGDEGEGRDMGVLLDLMTQAQDFGQPPAEIVQALGGGSGEGSFADPAGGMAGLLHAALASEGGGDTEGCCVM